jgi:phosphoenolpyruvate-protein kinase (PTS system EI component)
VSYFAEVSGIVSSQGGTLSHLSIMARERGVPVVVGADLTVLGIRLGETVSIDGNTGKISRVV